VTSAALLLDTCAAIWLANRQPLSMDCRPAIDAAVRDGLVLVSPVSAWEIGNLSRRHRSGGPEFLPDPKTWFARLLSGPGVRLAPFTAEIAIDSAYLPGALHGDPGDRLLIATARHLNIPIVTRDRLILEYAAQGHVGAIAC
jgi:PIN domain nuclease of toxin-antitoxin system